MSIDDFMSGCDAVFFKPTERFFEVLTKLPWRWKRYHDVGAGVGFLTKQMRERGFEVEAYDLYPRAESLVEVKKCDVTSAEDFWVGRKDSIIIARPCHGKWMATIVDRYYDEADILYVGLERNFGIDLVDVPGGPYHYEVLANDVGEDGEKLIRIFGPERNMMHLVRYEEDGGWWKLDGDKLRNRVGGWNVPRKGEDFQAHLFVCDWEQVYYPESLLVLDKDIGWIAPDGTWYGNLYRAHDACMEGIIGISVPRAEQDLRFVRCHGGGGVNWQIRSEEHRDKPTPEQARVMRRKGYKLDKWR